MRINRLVYDGKIYTNWEAEDVLAAGVPQADIEQALLDQAWSLVRGERDRLLTATDYAILPDYPITEEQKAEVTSYRQTLRDIPETFDSPDAVEWPNKPEVLSQ